MLADAIHIVQECLRNEIKILGRVITRFPSFRSGLIVFEFLEARKGSLDWVMLL